MVGSVRVPIPTSLCPPHVPTPQSSLVSSPSLADPHHVVGTAHVPRHPSVSPPHPSMSPCLPTSPHPADPDDVVDAVDVAVPQVDADGTQGEAELLAGAGDGDGGAGGSHCRGQLPPRGRVPRGRVRGQRPRGHGAAQGRGAGRLPCAPPLAPHTRTQASGAPTAPHPWDRGPTTHRDPGAQGTPPAPRPPWGPRHPQARPPTHHPPGDQGSPTLGTQVSRGPLPPPHPLGPRHPRDQHHPWGPRCPGCPPSWGGGRGRRGWGGVPGGGMGSLG